MAQSDEYKLCTSTSMQRELVIESCDEPVSGHTDLIIPVEPEIAMMNSPNNRIMAIVAQKNRKNDYCKF